MKTPGKTLRGLVAAILCLILLSGALAFSGLSEGAPFRGSAEGRGAVSYGAGAENAATSEHAAAAVKSIRLNKSKLSLYLNHTARLKAKTSPKSAAGTISWTSSDESVVTVDERGLVTAVGIGKAVVTARAENGKNAKCEISAKALLPKSVNFDELYVTLNPGGTYAAHAKVKPSDASDPSLIYSSSDASVAMVDENGVITAVSVGSATISCRCAATENVKNTCKVCVIAPGSKRMEGLIIGINPGHQKKTITKKYPIAPGSKKKAYGCKAGACGKWTRVNEYETTLQVGLKLQKLLTEQGATVVMTRTRNDVSITNIDRAKMLNKAGVDVALQLHCDSSQYQYKHGCCCYIRTTGKWVAESRAIAKALGKGMKNTTGCTNLGVKTHDEYMSLNWSTTPSVLIEMGYISNKKEDKLLASDSYRQQMAMGIMEGLCAYFGR